MLHRNATVLAAAIVTSVTMARAQAPATQPEVGPRVGEMAPDFVFFLHVVAHLPQRVFRMQFGLGDLGFKKPADFRQAFLLLGVELGQIPPQPLHGSFVSAFHYFFPSLSPARKTVFNGVPSKHSLPSVTRKRACRGANASSVPFTAPVNPFDE